MIIHRRKFLQRTGIAGFGLVIPAQPLLFQWDQQQDRYQNLKTRRYLGKVKVETRIDDAEVFTEGPAVDKNGHVYFTNIPANQILRWDPASKKLEIFKKNSHAANGIAV